MKIFIALIFLFGFSHLVISQKDSTSVDLQSFFDNLDLSADKFYRDTSISLQHYGTLRLSVSNQGSYRIFRQCDTWEVCNYFEGYLIQTEMGFLRIFSNRQLTSITRILLLDLDFNLIGSLSFSDHVLIGASSVEKTNREMGKLERFVFIQTPYRNLRQLKIEELINLNFMEELVRLHWNSGFNIGYERYLFEDEIFFIFRSSP